MFNLSSLKAYLKSINVREFFFKVLSENDNSKNQIYLGGSYEVLQEIPFGDIYMEQGLKNPTYKASLDFWWIGDNEETVQAPHAQLVLYPKYPEVRLSGFLLGCPIAPSEFLKEVPRDERTGKHDGRVLVLAPAGRRIYSYLATPGSELSNNLLDLYPKDSLFGHIDVVTSDSRRELVSLLKEAYRLNPHRLVRLFPDGVTRLYNKPNAAGYTLEAFFGIIPNGIAEPDYKGWELKTLNKSVATLMTPQPDGGLYKEMGNDSFVRSFGHTTPDGRLYFTGITSSKTTDKRLIIKGFDSSSGKITDASGFIGIQQNDIILASWSFPHILRHWNIKHNKACYVRYKKTLADYISFLPEILLCEKTTAIILMKGISDGTVYLDPACRIGKARNQFRVKYNQLSKLYEKSEKIQLV